MAWLFLAAVLGVAGTLIVIAAVERIKERRAQENASKSSPSSPRPASVLGADSAAPSRAPRRRSSE